MTTCLTLSSKDFNLYKTFYDVAKYGSISKAAQYGFTSQPAVSKSIKKLEDEFSFLYDLYPEEFI